MVQRLAAAALVVLFTSATGQDIRGLGMGRLTLVIESEVKPFDMYGFGGNPAGLYRSELPRAAGGASTAVAQTSVLDLYVPGSFWRYAGAPPYEWAIGEPLPNQLQECFPTYVSDGWFPYDWCHLTGDWIPYVPFAARPSGAFWRYLGKFALAAHGTWSYAAMVPGDAAHVSTPEVDVTAAVPLGPFDVGLDLPASLTTSTFGYEWEQFAVIGYRLGAVVPLHLFDLGVVVAKACPYEDARWPPPMKQGLRSIGTAENYALQAIARPAEWLKFGAAGGYRLVSTGSVFKSPWAGLRAECRPKNLPLLAGLEAEWARLRTDQPEMEEIDQMDSVGIGAGLGVRVWRLLVGAEQHFAQRTYPEDTGAVLKPNWTTNAGAELDLGVVQVRVGYEHSVRPVVDVPGIGFNKYTGTAGFGLNLASVRIDVAWDHSYWPFGSEIEDEVHLDIRRGW